MSKSTRSLYVCCECGYENPKWQGRCPGCGSWNTMEESAAGVFVSKAAQAQPLSQISTAAATRSTTGMSELDRVLGGGLVTGMVVLLGGDPGIGKSTLLLQVTGNLSKSASVLYISGEESPSQIKMRAERLNIHDKVFLLTETDMALIESELIRIKPAFAVIDSIQTMTCAELPGSAGSISQVRGATSLLTKIAKQTGTVILIVGHVTKDGAIAGPRTLEHMVDAVLYFEGERHADFRLLRAVKNRFGATNEVGVFEMRDDGMHPVKDPSRLFLSGRNLEGCAVTCVLEGTRTMLIEVQSLLAQTAFGSPRRTAAGVDTGRLALLLAVLENKAQLRLSDKDVYLNVVGGLRIVERAADLAIAMCLASCSKQVPIKQNTAIIGEVGLTGEIRTVSQMEKRIRECIRLGFSNIILPACDLKNIQGAQLRKAGNIKEAVALLLDGHS